MKRFTLALCLLAAFEACGADRLIFEEREKVVAALGDPVERVENARASLPTMDVQRFRKDGWEFVIYFDTDRADRIVISKQDGAALNDREITEFLLPNKSYNSWSQWKLPERRAWVSDGKIGPLYALLSSNGRSLELVTDRYLRNLAKNVWLESVEPLPPKQP